MKFTLIIIICLLGIINTAYAETLLKDSTVCWLEKILINYKTADEATKKDMEDHECLVWSKDMKAKVLMKKNVVISGVPYSIANIELSYEYYGERNDNVWTFTKNLSSE